MWKAIQEVTTDILSRQLNVFLIVAGIALFVYGSAGGVHPWAVINNQIIQIAVMVAGVALVVVGLVYKPPVNRTRFGIRITHPTNNDHVEAPMSVRGNIEKALGPGQELWLLRLYPGRDDYVPMGKARFYDSEDHWRVDNCHVGGASGDTRIIGACIVGLSGQALIKYFDEVSRYHNGWMDQLGVPKEAKNRYVPPLTDMTDDMIIAHTINVVRK